MAKTLDLSTTDFDRATVCIDGEPFEMRTSEELGFAEFGRHLSIGKRMIEISKEGVDEESLLELQELTIEGVHLFLIDVPDEVASKITPGLYGKIQSFFTKLAKADDDDEAEASESVLNSSPGASDSIAASEAA